MRILIADDHEIVRRGVRTLLQSRNGWEICGEAVDGYDLVQKAKQLTPDVLVVDVSMPNMNGLEATRILRRLVPQSEIVILSQHESSEMVRQAFTAGARAYVVKSSVARDLLTAVERAGRHEPFYENKLTDDRSGRMEPKEVLERGAALETALRESEERYRALVTATAQTVWRMDPEGRVTWVSPSWFELTGQNEQESIGSGWVQVLHPDDREHVLQVQEEAIRTGHPAKVEARFRIRDGSYRHFLAQGVPVRNADGKVREWVGTNIDISERKEIEQALLKERERLEALVEQRTSSLRRLSGRLLHLQDTERRKIARELHDSLGQELVAVKILLEDCKKARAGNGLAPLNECQEAVERCLAETRTLSHLLHPPLLDEAGFASAARWYVEGFSQRSGIAVTLEVPESLERLPSTAEIALFRVLQESLTNIHRHSGSRTAVVRVEVGREKVRLTIRDDGKGIPGQLLERFRTAGTDVGVGLSGMRERMRELGGQLEIYSRVGTTVSVTLPLAQLVEREQSTGVGASS